MTETSARSGTFVVLFICVGGGIALLDGVLKVGHGATLLYTLTFWVAVVEGCIALVAIVEAGNGIWIRPFKRNLLSVYPLLLLSALLFVFMSPKMEFYPWVHREGGRWLNKNFFLLRNALLLLVTFVLARKYAIESLRESEKRRTYAVLYLFIFVVSQSMVAFDWVMSLEYPWINTLFGGFFFVEAIYAAQAVSGIILFMIFRRSTANAFEPYRKPLRDLANFMFGFSMVWVGLFYSQYLVIWYGHIPEESLFLVERLAHSPLRELSIAVVPLLFVIPFVTLLSKKAKFNSYVVLFASMVVLTGILIERWVILSPRIPIHGGLLVLEFAGMTALFVMLIAGKRNPVTEGA